MTPKEYQEKIARFDLTQAQYAEDYYWRLAEPGILQLDHYIHGLSSEVGELSDALKKYLRDGKSVDMLNIKEELGDVLWYVTRAATLLNTSIEDLMKINVGKLEQRYPNGFTESPKRDTKAEQLAMLQAIETEETREQARRLKLILTQNSDTEPSIEPEEPKDGV